MYDEAKNMNIPLTRMNKVSNDDEVPHMKKIISLVFQSLKKPRQENVLCMYMFNTQSMIQLE